MINFKIVKERYPINSRYYIYSICPNTFDFYLTNDYRVIKDNEIGDLFNSEEINKYFYFKTREEAEQAIREYKKSMEFITEEDFTII